MPSNLEAARSGERKQALEQLRDTLAEQIDTTESNVHAQLAAQYRATLADLAELSGEVTVKAGVDELKSRRSAKSRGATSDASANA